MLSWTWCIPALPLAGFLVLATLGGRLSRPAAGAVGAGWFLSNPRFFSGGSTRRTLVPWTRRSPR